MFPVRSVSTSVNSQLLTLDVEDRITWHPFSQLRIQFGNGHLLKENWRPPNWFVVQSSSDQPQGPFNFTQALNCVSTSNEESAWYHHVRWIGDYEALKDSFRLQIFRESPTIKDDIGRGLTLRKSAGGQIEGVVLSPGNYCSAKCGYCYAETRFKNTPTDTTSDHILKKTFELIRSHPLIKEGCSITIGGGGDPIENFDFYIKTIELAREYRRYNGSEIPIYISTLDPRFLKEEYIDTILQNQSWITLSIDGDPATTFDRAKPKFRHFIQAYKSRCKWAASAVFTAKTAKHIAHNYEYLIDAGFDAVQMRPTRLASNHPLFLTADHYEIAVEQYSQLTGDFLKAGKIVDLFARLTSSDYLGRYFFRYLTEVGITNRCGAGLATFFVSPLGEMFPCPSTAHESVKLGDINSGSLSLPVINSIHNKSVDCQQCNIFNVCGGPCTHESILIAEQPGELNEDVCIFQRALCSLAIDTITHLYKSQPASLINILTSVIERTDDSKLY